MSSLEEQCHIDKGTYTDGPVLTKDIRNLFDRIAELEAEVARLTELLEPEECDGGCPERICLRCCSDRLAMLETENARLLDALTPSEKTKVAYMGQFSFSIPDVDEDGNEVERAVQVPWTAIKEIMAAIHSKSPTGEDRMTLRQNNSAASRIIRSVYFEQGIPFSVSEIADHIGVSEGMARAAVMALKDSCELMSDSRGTYWRRKTHFIHQRRLANPVTEEGEFES